MVRVILLDGGSYTSCTQIFFPQICRKRYLFISATVKVSERLFSAEANIVTWSTLKPATVYMLDFLNKIFSCVVISLVYSHALVVCDILHYVNL